MLLFEINIKSSAKSVFYFCGSQELKDTVIHVPYSLLYNWILNISMRQPALSNCVTFSELHGITEESLKIPLLNQ